MHGWIETSECRICGPGSGCENTGHERYPVHVLSADDGRELAIVSDFGYALYGTTAYGRTGPRLSLEHAQQACLQMIETGSDEP